MRFLSNLHSIDRPRACYLESFCRPRSRTKRLKTRTGTGKLKGFIGEEFIVELTFQKIVVIFTLNFRRFTRFHAVSTLVRYIGNYVSVPDHVTKPIGLFLSHGSAIMNVHLICLCPINACRRKSMPMEGFVQYHSLQRLIWIGSLLMNKIYHK